MEKVIIYTDGACSGSPQAQRIMIQRQGNIEGKKALAKEIAGIK